MMIMSLTRPYLFFLLSLLYSNVCKGQYFIKVQGPNTTIEICDYQTSHLIFEADILYIDIGNINTHIIDYTNNVLRIKGEKTDKKTNLTVITTDNSYYSFYVVYSSRPQLNYFVYKVSRLHQIPDTSMDAKKTKEENRIDTPTPAYTDNSTTTTKAISYQDSYQENLNELQKNDFPTIEQMENNPRYGSKTSINIPSPNRKRKISTPTASRIIESEGKVYRQKETAYDGYALAITRTGYKVLEKLRLYTHIKNRHGKVTLRVTGIYHSLDHAFIKYEVENMSSIPYDIQYIEFGMIEKKKPRRTAYTEEKLDLITIINGDITRVLPSRIYRYVAILPKLVVPEDRSLFMEMVETGRRNINLPIPYNRVKIETIKVD